MPFWKPHLNNLEFRVLLATPWVKLNCLDSGKQPKNSADDDEKGKTGWPSANKNRRRNRFAVETKLKILHAEVKTRKIILSTRRDQARRQG